MILAAKILVGLLAVAFGVWLGLPGRYQRDEDEIDRALGRPGSSHRKARRHFTPLDWLRNDTRGSDRRRAATSRRFRTAAPKRSSD